MALPSSLLSYLYPTRPWPTLLPTYWNAFDGLETFVATDTGYYIEVMVPGFTKEDLTLEIHQDRYLILQGESRRTHKHRTISQKWRLPNDVDIKSLSAKVNNGVLTLDIKKNTSASSSSDIHTVPIW